MFSWEKAFSNLSDKDSSSNDSELLFGIDSSPVSTFSRAASTTSAGSS